MTEKRECPQCGATEVVPILYGYPCARDVADGKFLIGGCIPDPDAQWGCRACGARFRDTDGVLTPCGKPPRRGTA